MLCTLLDAEPFRHQLLKRYHRLLLVRPPGIDSHGDGEAVPVKKKTHLDDRVGPVLLALTVGSEAVLLLDLEVEVGAVVVGDACVDVGILLHSLECLFLDEIEAFCGFLICQELFFKRLKENDSGNYYSNIKECIL